MILEKYIDRELIFTSNDKEVDGYELKKRSS